MMLEASTLLSAGIFTVVTIGVAADRLKRWMILPVEQFRDNFRRVIAVADIVQPFLLVIAVVSAGIFSANETGLAKTLALVGAGLFLLIFVLSLVVLVPLQRKIISTALSDKEVMKAMFTIWAQGHRGRTVLSVIAFGLLVGAVMA